MTPRSRRKRIRLVVGWVTGLVALLASGILVVSAIGAPPPGKKMTICHKTHSVKRPNVTLSISVKAWKGHSRHGDSVGACQTLTTSAPGKGNSANAPGHDVARPGNSESSPGHDAAGSGNSESSPGHDAAGSGNSENSPGHNK